MLKNTVFYFSRRFLHDRKLPSVVTQIPPTLTNYNPKLIGTQSPRKADHYKEKNNKELFIKKILKTKSKY